jgi:hypothetical protein
LPEQQSEAEARPVIGRGVSKGDSSECLVTGDQHRQRCRDNGQWAQRRFFFLAPERALERPSVNGPPKAALNVNEQRRGAERRLVGAKGAHKGHDLVVELVGPSGAALARHQPGKALVTFANIGAACGLQRPSGLQQPGRRQMREARTPII